MKDIVVYYSLEGNTKQAAKTIADKLNADILQIETVKRIPEGAAKYIVGGVQATFGICSKIIPIDIDFSKYDRIILGTPIWAGKGTPAVKSFLKDYNAYDKVVALFTCSGGGGNGKCVSQMKKKLKNLKTIADFVDRREPLSSENEEKLNRFVDALKDK